MPPSSSLANYNARRGINEKVINLITVRQYLPLIMLSMENYEHEACVCVGVLSSQQNIYAACVCECSSPSSKAQF